MENKTTSPGEECIVLHTDTFEISDAATGKDLPKNYFSNWRFILIVLVSAAADGQQECRHGFLTHGCVLGELHG